MANIIVCCDGTWNTAGQRDQGLPCPTNVVKIYNALAEADNIAVRQKTYYHPGVGAEGDIFEHFLGGTLGDGLDKNIKSAYGWLGQEYAPGDKIFIFGFSRGAYTARYLAGMLCDYGLADFATKKTPDAEIWERVDRILDADRKGAKPETLNDIDFFNTPKGENSKGTTPIHFLGVWDTVGALGVPSNFALLQLLDWLQPFRFQDTKLSDCVRHARHAVAMDERRETFTPTLWTDTGEHPDAKQIWFPGVHGDVGGGHAQCGLSDGALLWMMDEAEAQGLAFRDRIRDQLSPDPRGVLHTSEDGVLGKLPTLPRSAPQLRDGATAFHASALDRWKNPPIEQSPYWPTRTLKPGAEASVDVYAREHWNATGFYLEAGAQYDLTAEGQWIDGDVPCDADGPQEGQFHLGRIIQMAGSALGEAEKLFQNATNNPQAHFVWTKQVEDFEWFALVGVLANGMGTDAQGNPQTQETFKIGKSCKGFSPRQSGYLHCFANDAWPAYGNNRGSVRLTIKRVH